MCSLYVCGSNDFKLPSPVRRSLSNIIRIFWCVTNYYNMSQPFVIYLTSSRDGRFQHGWEGRSSGLQSQAAESRSQQRALSRTVPGKPPQLRTGNIRVCFQTAIEFSDVCCFKTSKRSLPSQASAHLHPLCFSNGSQLVKSDPLWIISPQINWQLIMWGP